MMDNEGSHARTGRPRPCVSTRGGGGRASQTPLNGLGEAALQSGVAAEGVPVGDGGVGVVCAVLGIDDRVTLDKDFRRDGEPAGFFGELEANRAADRAEGVLEDVVGAGGVLSPELEELLGDGGV